MKKLYIFHLDVFTKNGANRPKGASREVISNDLVDSIRIAGLLQEITALRRLGHTVLFMAEQNQNAEAYLDVVFSPGRAFPAVSDVVTARQDTVLAIRECAIAYNLKTLNAKITNNDEHRIFLVDVNQTRLKAAQEKGFSVFPILPATDLSKLSSVSVQQQDVTSPLLAKNVSASFWRRNSGTITFVAPILLGLAGGGVGEAIAVAQHKTWEQITYTLIGFGTTWFSSQALLGTAFIFWRCCNNDQAYKHEASSLIGAPAFQSGRQRDIKKQGSEIHFFADEENDVESAKGPRL